MTRAQNPNLEILMLAVDQLGELADAMVFLGGCATGLLITDPAAPPIRITQDVDAIVQVVSHAEYYQLSEKLRTKGFTEDTSDGAPICRWKTDNVILNIMPTETQILGFGNNWYTPAFEQAERMPLFSGTQIRMVSGPYFLITKLEAYEGRGAGDYQMSHDIEDIVAVLDGRLGIAEEVKQADPNLRQELSDRFIAMLNDQRFVEAVSGHMPTDDTSQAHVPIIMKIIEEIAGNK